jgi:hypothetical protein
LPKQIPVEDCKYFEEILDLPGKNDAAHYSYFYSTCIRSGDQEILPQVEAYLAGNGRMLYVLPVFRAMVDSEWARGHARRILEQVQERQHAITVYVTDKFLKEGGL